MKPIGVAGAVAALGLLSACAERVSLHVYNETRAPMTCRIMFAHWVELAEEGIPPDRPFVLHMQRQVEDGALYVFRNDGRKLMIENLLCGPTVEWWANRSEIPLLPVRAGRDRGFVAACSDAGGFECHGPGGPEHSRRR